MSDQLNTLLKKAYHRWKNDNNPPLPLKAVKEYLSLEGITLEDDNE